MWFDDVWLITKMDMKMWSRLHHLLVDTAHKHDHKRKNTGRGRYKGQSVQRGCYCTAFCCSTALVRCCRCSVYPGSAIAFRIPSKRGVMSSCPVRSMQLSDPLLCVGSNFLERQETFHTYAHTDAPSVAVTKARASCATAVVPPCLPQSRELELEGRCDDSGRAKSWKCGVSTVLRGSA